MYFCDTNNQRFGDRAVKVQSACILLKLSWYKCELEFYNFNLHSNCNKNSYTIYTKGNKKGIYVKLQKLTKHKRQ